MGQDDTTNKAQEGEDYDGPGRRKRPRRPSPQPPSLHDQSDTKRERVTMGQDDASVPAARLHSPRPYMTWNLCPRLVVESGGVSNLLLERELGTL